MYPVAGYFIFKEPQGNRIRLFTRGELGKDAVHNDQVVSREKTEDVLTGLPAPQKGTLHLDETSLQFLCTHIGRELN